LQEDGTPDRAKDGMVRYYVSKDNDFVFADTREELEAIYGTGEEAED
jgi:hypothetical protein